MPNVAISIVFKDFFGCFCGLEKDVSEKTGCELKCFFADHRALGTHDSSEYYQYFISVILTIQSCCFLISKSTMQIIFLDKNGILHVHVYTQEKSEILENNKNRIELNHFVMFIIFSHTLSLHTIMRMINFKTSRSRKSLNSDKYSDK